MKTRFLLALAATCLAAGIAVAQQANDSFDLLATPELPQTGFAFFDDGSYLGVYAEDISRENMARYSLSQPRGVGITQVAKDSPAEKAGLRKDDVILRLDGENVTSVRKLNRLVSELAPDQTVRISISRGGAEQEVSATIAKRQNQMARLDDLVNKSSKNWKWEGPFANGEGNMVFALGNARRIGISTTELTRQLADYFGVPGGKGVLITAVTEDGPAAKAGLKAGDVITAVDGEKIDSTGDISRLINAKKEGEVTLTVIRNKSQQTFRVTPKEGIGFPSRTIIRPQIGRRIVIPKVEIPNIPDIEIPVPRIELQSIPSINITLPNVRITPQIKPVRVLARPI